MSYSCRGYYIYLTVYYLIYLMKKSNLERSGKSKADEGEQNSELIQILPQNLMNLSKI